MRPHQITHFCDDINTPEWVFFLQEIRKIIFYLLDLLLYVNLKI